MEEIKIAETMLSKSNEKYLEVGNIQSNSDNEEKKKTKEIDKLEKETQGLSEKSLMKYKEIYANLHSVLVRKIEEEDKKHPAYNESNSRTETNKNTLSGKKGTERAKTFSGITPDTDNLYEFRVQETASRAPLSLYQLPTIYIGKRTISEIKEENRYNYQIRGTNLLSDAQKICSQSGIDNAYPEAYDNLKRIPLGSAAEKAKLLENVVERKGKARAFRQIDFSVQIAASKSRLSEEKLSGLFKCSDAVTVVFEGGWYKYQIYVGKNLDNAFRILDQCCHEKAFIVAYKNGKKIKLHTAIQEYKIYTP